MDELRRIPGRPAPYGQACLSCFKSKCKCIVRADGDKCDRCYRLNKDCRPGDSVRRQASTKNQRANLRIAELEGKLGDLVSLLHERKVIDGDAGAQSLRRRTLTPPDSRSRNSVETDDYRMQDGNLAGGNDDYYGDIAHPFPTPSSTGSVVTPSHEAAPPELSSDLEVAYFDIFRSRMLPSLPLLHLPADMTAPQLQRDRPFLYRAIICAASQSAQERQPRARELKRMLSEAVLLQERQRDAQHDAEHTMDLLLGTLVYIAWGWDHLLNGSSLSRLMMLAMSLVGEMRLSKCTSHFPHKLGVFTPGPGDPRRETNTGGIMTTAAFLERQRAVLGCFVLSAAVSFHFEEVEPLRWTQLMEESLAAINAHKESPLDAVLAAQVRLKLLAVKAAQFRDQQQDLDQVHIPGFTSPAVLYTQTLLMQLQEPRRSVSPLLMSNHVLSALTHYTELRILEAASPSASSPGSSPLPSDSVSCLWKTEIAVKSAATALLAISPTELLGASFVQWAQCVHLAHCIATLNRLAGSFVNQNVDPAATRALDEMPDSLDRLAEKLEYAAAEAGEKEPGDVFTQLARGMRLFRSSIPSHSLEMPQGMGQTLRTDSGATSIPGFWMAKMFDG
ncbi:C6 transcription factor [Colletotrichum musicola]|uniref:C6 transcription factor n=1 Tax=Colletotrichum musicola TaxID=2175873 RepID=A0A8H6KWY5_9PEZI|nr:C6 transcription factor [Colletotrichum musicola]